MHTLYIYIYIVGWCSLDYQEPNKRSLVLIDNERKDSSYAGGKKEKRKNKRKERKGVVDFSY